MNRDAAARFDAVKRSVPATVLTRLTELHALTTKVRGTTPLDAPERAAESGFRALVEATLTLYGVSEWHLAPAIGMQSRTLVAWMRSHGLKPQCPSQKSYRGVLTPREKRRRLVVGGTCSKGHLLEAETIAEYPLSRGGVLRQCRDCQRARYTAKKSH